MRNALATLTILTVVSIAALASASPPEWPCWNGPNRDGRSPDTGLLKEWPKDGPKLLWKSEDIGGGFSSPIVADGMIYVTGDVGATLTLFALDADGKTKWKQGCGPDGRPQYPGTRSTPAYDNGKLYVLSAAGALVCLDAKKDGAKVWSKDAREFGGRAPQWGYSESPLIYENTVIFTPGGQTAMVALDKATGAKAWASPVRASAHYCSAVATTQASVPIIINGSGDGLFAVNAKTGAKLWMENFAAGNVANCPSPVVSNGMCVWAVGYGKGAVCMKLDGGKATRAWTSGDLDCHHGGYVIDNGYVYGVNYKGAVCIDLKSGATKWTGNGVGKGSICFADGMLYLFNERGQAGLAVCSPDKLQMKGTVQVSGSDASWAHPVVIGGRLYLRYHTTLYCFDVKGN